MGSEDEPGAPVEKELNRRKGGPDAGVVPDFPLLVQGDVEVHPDKDGLAADVQVLDEAHGRHREMNFTRSTRRQE